VKDGRPTVGAVFFAAYVDARYVPQRKSENRTLQMIDTIHHDIVAKHPEVFRFAATADDIEAARKEGKIAALIGIEGGHAIEDSLRLLRMYYTLGVRYMTLTHNNTNNWADSIGDIDDPKIQHHNGLTDFGKQVVREMNRLGMMVDISHVSDKTFYDALETSRAPLIATHSGARSICSHPRNMSDGMLRALARKNGVAQVNFGCDFLSEERYQKNKAFQASRADELAEARKIDDPEARRARLAEIRRGAELPGASVADVVAHIDHIVKVAGINHVGIGTDFDGVPCVPADVSSYDRFPVLTRALLEKGYSAGDIQKIYGGNLLRVMRAAEKISRESPRPRPVVPTNAPQLMR
jgi:membrane dipeptidase